MHQVAQQASDVACNHRHRVIHQWYPGVVIRTRHPPGDELQHSGKPVLQQVAFAITTALAVHPRFALCVVLVRTRNGYDGTIERVRQRLRDLVGG